MRPGGPAPGGTPWPLWVLPKAGKLFFDPFSWLIFSSQYFFSGAPGPPPSLGWTRTDPSPPGSKKEAWPGHWAYFCPREARLFARCSVFFLGRGAFINTPNIDIPTATQHTHTTWAHAFPSRRNYPAPHPTRPTVLSDASAGRPAGAEGARGGHLGPAVPPHPPRPLHRNGDPGRLLLLLRYPDPQPLGDLNPPK